MSFNKYKFKTSLPSVSEIWTYYQLFWIRLLRILNQSTHPIKQANNRQFSNLNWGLSQKPPLRWIKTCELRKSWPSDFKSQKKVYRSKFWSCSCLFSPVQELQYKWCNSQFTPVQLRWRLQNYSNKNPVPFLISRLNTFRTTSGKLGKLCKFIM